MNNSRLTWNESTEEVLITAYSEVLNSGNI